MIVKRVWSLSTLVGFAIGLGLFNAVPSLARASCAPTDAALNKIFTTPTHIYTTLTFGSGSVDHSEVIYVGGSVYSKINGVWSRGDLQQIMTMERKNRANSKVSCSYVRDDVVNGEPAAIYAVHSIRTDVDVKSDGQMWISKSTGLVLRDQTRITGGMGGEQTSTRYEYTNVKPPR